MSEPTGGAAPPPPNEHDAGTAQPPVPQPPAQQPAAPQPPAQQPPAQAQGSWQAPIEAGPAPGVVYADLVTRVIAYFIDALILGVVWSFIWFVVVGSLFVTSGFAVLAAAGIVLGVIWAALSAVYFVYGWTRLRASPGQRLLGLETVNAADGATLSQDRAIQRWIYLFGIPAILTVLGNIVGLVGSLLGLIGLGYIIYLLYTASQSPKRQGFHDIQAATVVIKHVA